MAPRAPEMLIEQSNLMQPAVALNPFKNLVKINISMKKCASRRGPLRLQSGPAPGAGALGLTLLELKLAAVLARIGASWEM